MKRENRKVGFCLKPMKEIKKKKNETNERVANT